MRQTKLRSTIHYRISPRETLNYASRSPPGHTSSPFCARPCGRRRVAGLVAIRSEEHTSELQSLMRISYAVFCLKKKNKLKDIKQQHRTLIITQNKTNKRMIR